MAKVRKAVIPAAGRGTRQFPASRAVKKEMFPLVDRDGVAKPTVQIIIEEAIGSGVEEICVVTPPGQEKHYRDYFRRTTGPERAVFGGKDWAVSAGDKLGDLGDRLHFAVQETPEGFGHAVYQAKAFAAGEPVLLMLGDHIYVSDTQERCARQVIRVFEENALDAVTGVQPTTEKDLHLFGVIRGRRVDAGDGVFRAEAIVEKPSPDYARQHLVTPGLPVGNYYGHFGIHVFGPGIFDALQHLIRNDLREKNEFQLTSAQEHLRSQTDKYWIADVKGQRLDTGIPYGLMETQIALALAGVHRAGICESIARMLAMQGSRQG